MAAGHMRARKSSKSARLDKLLSKLSLKRWLTRKQLKQDFFMADEFDQVNDDTDSDQSDNEDSCYAEVSDNNVFNKVRYSVSSTNCGTDFKFQRSLTSTTSSPQIRHSSATLMQQDSEILRSKLSEEQQFRIFAATWNVGGKPPNEEVALGEWLSLEAPADIYVLGFQEVVPLNASNLLGSENTVPAAKWLHLIRKILNKSNAPCTQSLRRSSSTPSSMWQNIGCLDTRCTACSIKESNTDAHITQGSVSYNDPKLLMDELTCPRGCLKLNASLTTSFEETSQDPYRTEAQIYNMRASNYIAAREGAVPCLSSSLSTNSMRCESSQYKSRFSLIASKQMVGLFVSVWIRTDLRHHVRNLKVSCVGCGLLGYLGNKGSISISMSIHQNSFCFVCSHLTSGKREKDELKRNSDVFEILKRTEFCSSHNLNEGKFCPENILDHDTVIWLGDLNYRLALTQSDTKSLLALKDWSALLERDQLNMHRKAGRVFAGWQEGEIAFAPTYKYCANSDSYALGKLNGEKLRTPAWFNV